MILGKHVKSIQISRNKSFDKNKYKMMKNNANTNSINKSFVTRINSKLPLPMRNNKNSKSLKKYLRDAMLKDDEPNYIDDISSEDEDDICLY